MSVDQKIINLYIHPDSGPIISMPLDMLEVEISVIHTGGDSNRDEARVREIIERIRSKFPKVRPEDRTQELRWLISRLANVSVYDGIVLRLPGQIDGPLQPKNTTSEDFQLLTQQASVLQTQLEQAKQQRNKVQALVPSLQSENAQLRNAHQGQYERIVELQNDMQNVENRAYNASLEARKWREQADRIEQEKVALQVELDKAKQDRQVTANLQKEVATLRQQRDDLKAIEQQLRAAVKDRDKKIEDQQRKLDRVIEDLQKLSSQNPSIEELDKAKDPWLD